MFHSTKLPQIAFVFQFKTKSSVKEIKSPARKL